MGIEAEGVVLQALPLQIRVLSRIIYLDRSEATDLQVMDFPDLQDDGAQPKTVHLLLKPGHYDVLYPGGTHCPNWKVEAIPVPKARVSHGSASHLVQAPPAVMPGQTVQYGFRDQLYNVVVPAHVLPGEMFEVSVPLAPALPVPQSESDRVREAEQLQRVLQQSQQEAQALEASSRIGGSRSGAAAAAAEHASWWQAEQHVHAFNALAEEWQKGRIIAVLSTKIRVEFDMRDKPVAFEQVKDARTASFWQGNPDLLVGAQVQVRWSADGGSKWYRGMITEYAPSELDPNLDCALRGNREALTNLGKDLKGMHHGMCFAAPPPQC